MKDTAWIKAGLSKTLFGALQVQALLINVCIFLWKFCFFILPFTPPNNLGWRAIFWHQQTVSTKVDINESLITTQLRLMASIFCPLFSFDGGSIKVGHVPEGRTHKVGITKKGKILIFGFCLQGFGDCFCLVVFCFCFTMFYKNTKKWWEIRV